MVLDLRPPVVSFHFGLPPSDTMKRIKQTGAVVLSSATTVAEARRLEAEGADAIIAQGLEAGGHRGTFTEGDGAGLIGTMALVPQMVDAVGVPVIAAGGIADGRGIAAAFALGASGVQIGTAFLGCPEAAVPRVHRDALHGAADEDTRLTRVFTGRPARAEGPAKSRCDCPNHGIEAVIGRLRMHRTISFKLEELNWFASWRG